MERKIIYFGDYFKGFIESLNEDVREKIDYVLDMFVRLKKLKKNTMNTKENLLHSYDEVLDEKYGKVGTPERTEFRKKAYAFYMGQVIREARKEEKMSQTELGKRIGANKSYISRIENGLIDPTISTIYSIINALGLRIEIVKPAE